MTITEAEAALERARKAKKARDMNAIACLSYPVIFAIGFFFLALFSEGIGAALLLAFIGFVVGEILCAMISSIESEDSKAKDLPLPMAEADLKQAYIDFYTKCVKAGANPNNDLDLLAIGSTEGISDIEILRKRYSRAAEIAKAKPLEEKWAKEAEKEAERANARLAALRDEPKIARLTGREKYLVPLRKQLAQAKAEEIKAHNEFRAYCPGLPTQHDPIVHGAIADAIAGPAAGVTIAAQIAAENQQAMNEYRERLSQPPSFLQLMASQKLSNAERKVKELEASIASIKTKMVIDSSDAKDLGLYSKITLDDLSFELDGCFLTVEASAKVSDELALLDKPARIDGTILIHIKDNDTQEVLGKVYLNAPGYGMSDLEKAGFPKGETQLIGHCNLTRVPNAIDHVEDPLNLWLIEL